MTDEVKGTQMSEGPEVKRTADKLSSVLVGQTIEKIFVRKSDSQEIVQRLIGTNVKQIHTHGKNMVIEFTNEIFLRNHMMMWGKWRIYDRKQFDEGRAKSPPSIGGRRHTYQKMKTDKKKSSNPQLSIAFTKVERNDGVPENNTVTNNNPFGDSTLKEIDGNNSTPSPNDVRTDRRVRLAIFTRDSVVVQFNGPILSFSESDPFLTDQSLTRLGPDPLKSNFSYEEARIRFDARLKMKLADLLLDQTFVAGVGNKYKSELLFICKLNPFIAGWEVSAEKRDFLIKKIPYLLKFGYENAGRTRPNLEGEYQYNWNFKHWVFRRSGKPCWNCNSPIKFDRNASARISFWCPNCQKAA
jgi:formamidopyrimidine-DNA glycosylase